MKKQFFLFLLLGSVFFADAQLVPCRPKICMLDYNLHNDNFPNADMTTIKNVKPDILIDNTPGGYWGEFNGGIGCLPVQYTPLGIQVFSYIAGGYEGTFHGNNIDNLSANLARVDAIANDHATGVFLDEVSSFPTPAGKVYITAIWDRCIMKGLKLIVNPGVSSFDPWLMDHCHFLLSDEHYNGRALTASEAPYNDRILVVAQDVTNAAAAAAISINARAQGFGYSYACQLYINLPAWLSNYLVLCTGRPATPTITQSGFTLSSNAPRGNQWYRTGQGVLAGASGPTYTASISGTYYDQVTLQGCSSDTSNRINIVVTAVSGTPLSGGLFMYPNPAVNKLFVAGSFAGRPVIAVTIINMQGSVVLQTSEVSGNPVNIERLPAGSYFITARYRTIILHKLLVIQR